MFQGICCDQNLYTGACVLSLELIIELLAMAKYITWTYLLNSWARNWASPLVSTYVPMKNLSIKWFWNKEEHWTIIKQIFEIWDFYPNQVICLRLKINQQKEELNIRVIHHFKSYKWKTNEKWISENTVNMLSFLFPVCRWKLPVLIILSDNYEGLICILLREVTRQRCETKVWYRGLKGDNSLLHGFILKFIWLLCEISKIYHTLKGSLLVHML